ncbi:MAG: hypothetical protein ACI835_002241 [Planctomycetota bacterium]|jgi:hypothetical protein
MAGKPLLLAAVLCATSLSADAGSLRRLSVEEMTAISDEVVSGRVTRVESRWTDDHSQIFTYVTLDRVASHKGAATGEVTLIQLGGTVGDWSMTVSGAPVFTTGEEVVVFLCRMESAKRHSVATSRWLLGLGQGLWRVTRDNKTGADRAKVAIDSEQVMQRPSRSVEAELTYAELTARIKKTAREQRAAEAKKEAK